MAVVTNTIARIVAGITGVRSKTDSGYNNATRVRSVRVARKVHGTSAGQTSKVWTNSYTVANGGTQNISLGAVADGLGDALQIGSVSAVMFRTPATTGYFTITLPASLGGGSFRLLAGMTALFLVESASSAGFAVSDPAFVAESSVGSESTIEVTVVGVGA